MSSHPKATGRTTLGLVVAWLATYAVARGVLERPDLSDAVRVAVALLPIPFFAAFLWRAIAHIREADEFERRIHLEALAVAYPLVMLLLMTLGLLERAIKLNFQDWSYLHVWYFLPIFYLAGLALARQRYS